MHRSSLTRLQLGFPKLTEKEKHKQDEEAQKPFPVKATRESPKESTMKPTSAVRQTLSSKGKW